MSARRIPLVASWLVAASVMTAAAVAGPREAVIDKYAAQAKQADGKFSGFSAARGEAFFKANHTGGQPDTPSCTSCHGAAVTAAGTTRAGKAIEPLAPSKTPARFSDPDKVEKWFVRNCKSVLGRECTALEKGDFLAFVAGK